MSIKYTLLQTEAATLKNVSCRFVGLTPPGLTRYAHGQHPCQGLYWTLDTQKPDTAFMLTHYSADFSEHYLAGPLAARGYGVFGFNTRFRGHEDSFILEKAIEDIGVGVKWLVEEAGVKNVIFIGNSGGGSLMAAYQTAASRDSSLISCKAFIFLNAHPGRPDVLTNWLDPSVTDETDPVKTDESLDMYAERNKPPYSAEFIAKYRAAQRERNHRITAWAKEELRRLNNVGIPDRIFPLHRSMADLRFNDPTIDPSQRPTPASYLGKPDAANRDIGLLGRANTLQTWLSMWSLKESKIQLDRVTSGVLVPTLVIQADADVGVFPSDAATVYEQIPAQEKKMLILPGGHYFENSQQDLDGAANEITKWIGSVLPEIAASSGKQLAL